MPFLPLLFFILFSSFAVIICIQDFKHRLVSLWLLVAYSLACIASVYFTGGIYTLLANVLSTLIYFGLIFGILLLYYFVKEKKFSNPVDSRIGLADVILFIAIGLTLETVQLVLFFSAVFLISAVLGLLWFNKKGQTVPLAGILCVLHALYYFSEYLLY